FVEADDDPAQVGGMQPVGNDPAQHAGLVEARRFEASRLGGALAGDDKNQPVALRLRIQEKAPQSLGRLRLGHAMQIDRLVDRAPPARQLFLQAPLQRREWRWRRGFWRRVGALSLWLGGRGAWLDGRRQGFTRARQSRATAPLDAFGDCDPQIDLLVAEAAQAG